MSRSGGPGGHANALDQHRDAGLEPSAAAPPRQTGLAKPTAWRRHLGRWAVVLLTLAIASVAVGARVADAHDGVAALNPAPGVAIDAHARASVSGALLVDGVASPAYAATTLLHQLRPSELVGRGRHGGVRSPV